MAVALQIRDVPEEIRDVLTAQARVNGQSLQAYLLSLVTEEARRQRNLALMSRIELRTGGSNLSDQESDELVDAHRRERDSRFL